MRFLLLLFLPLLNLQASPEVAKELNYYSRYEKALAVAKKEDKPLMLVVVTSYCPWCRKFERKTLASKKIANKVTRTFIPIIVDRNKDAEDFPSGYQTPRIPTVFFIDSRSEEQYWQSIGYLNKVEFYEALEDAEKLFQKHKKKQ